MRFPYLGAMVHHFFDEAHFLMHSYSRVLYESSSSGRGQHPHNEAGWIVDYREADSGFVVILNGSVAQSGQVIDLTLTCLQTDEEYHVELNIKELAAFETLLLRTADFGDVANFTVGRSFVAHQISYNNSDAFGRTLVGGVQGERNFSGTHSNFNYSIFDTDTISQDSLVFLNPIIEGSTQTMVIDPYNYFAKHKSFYEDSEGVLGKNFSVIKSPSPRHEVQGDIPLPSRLVSVLFTKQNGQRLSNLCSLGATHASRPPKYTSWLYIDNPREDAVSYTLEPRESPNVTDSLSIVLSLFGPSSGDALQKVSMPIDRFMTQNTWPLIALFDVSRVKETDRNFWVLINSDYPCLTFYSVIYNSELGIAIEHSF